MLTTITYKATLNRNGRITAQGMRTIHIVVYQLATRKRATISTHIEVRSEDFLHGKVQPSEPNHDIYNRKIRRHIRRLMEYEDELESTGASVTPRMIADAARHSLTRTATVSEFVTSVIDPSDRAKTTKDAYHALAASIESYRQGTTIADVSYDFIERWRAHMRSLKLSENTVKGKLKQLHCLTQEAIKRNIITEDPFKWVTIGNMTPKAVWLNMDEIGRLEKARLKGRNARVRDLFLLGCYTALRWGDLHTLEQAEIRDGILTKTMHKTRHAVHIPIATLFWGKGMEIIRRYPDIRKLSRCVSCNSTANRIIKEIAASVGITKNVSFHCARKSCCSNLSLMGMPLQEISMVLGHQRTSTTDTYYLFSKDDSLNKTSGKIFKPAKSKKKEQR